MGESLGVRTVLNSLSATDFCVQMDRSATPGETLLVITQLSHAVLMLRGEVTRVQEVKADSYCLCLRIIQHQIFSSLAGEPQVERFNIKDSLLRDSHVSEIPLG